MARIIRQTTVVRDGWHNGFTDLQYWQGCYWVSYRKGSQHASIDGTATISVSTDRERFREVAKLRMPGDNRDPKMLPVDDSRMAVHFPSWTKGCCAKKLQQYISFSDNGYDWQKPIPILPSEKWLWRIRKHDGRYYALIQDLSGSWDGRLPHQLDLAVSDDLCDWRVICRVGEAFGLNESDIFWNADGEAWIVARSVRSENAYFCHSAPPYTKWTAVELTSEVHAPIFLEHEGVLYVAGRNNPIKEGRTGFPFPYHSLGLWSVERGAIKLELQMPALGDCSYPGMIKDGENRICMSYYSQHAYYLGCITPPSAMTANDVYFAEIEL